MCHGVFFFIPVSSVPGLPRCMRYNYAWANVSAHAYLKHAQLQRVLGRPGTEAISLYGQHELLNTFNMLHVYVTARNVQ